LSFYNAALVQEKLLSSSGYEGALD